MKFGLYDKLHKLHCCQYGFNWLNRSVFSLFFWCIKLFNSSLVCKMPVNLSNGCCTEIALTFNFEKDSLWLQGGRPRFGCM